MIKGSNATTREFIAVTKLCFESPVDRFVLLSSQSVKFTSAGVLPFLKSIHDDGEIEFLLKYICLDF